MSPQRRHDVVFLTRAYFYSRDAGNDELVQAEEGRHFGPQGYNMEFLKKRDEDLNITLIIVSVAVGPKSTRSDPVCRLVSSPP